VDFELAMPAFLVEGIQTPAELFDIARQFLEEGTCKRNLMEIVGRRRPMEGFVLKRRKSLFRPAQHIEFRFDAEVEDEIALCSLLARTLQDDTAAIPVGLAMKMEIGGKPAIAPVPGEDGCARKIGHRRAFVEMRADKP